MQSAYEKRKGVTLFKKYEENPKTAALECKINSEKSRALSSNYYINHMLDAEARGSASKRQSLLDEPKVSAKIFKDRNLLGLLNVISAEQMQMVEGTLGRRYSKGFI